jgi:hypothetical protein
MEDDIEKLNFYLNAEFFFIDDLLFSNLVYTPNLNKIKSLKTKYSKIEIEQLYNHFHLEALSDNIETQRKFSIELWQKWRAFFNDHMKTKSIAIEIHDAVNEIIIYLYEQ